MAICGNIGNLADTGLRLLIKGIALDPEITQHDSEAIEVCNKPIPHHARQTIDLRVLTDPEFVLKVLQGIQASPKANVLEDINELLKHLALTSKYPEEIAVVTKVWKEFKK